jgi:wobble nucleotide-excising tRNase
LLFSQRWDIEKLIDITKKIKKYEDAWKDINTGSITTLSKTASDELLISELEKSLNTELLVFNKKLSVKLHKVHQKWKVYTELKVKWHNAKDVFSEGESKALCLALFITELRYQKTPCVVFDDPVNSLDHEISEKFAERIIELSKTDMQVIVFTHNLLFARQLVSAVNEIELNESCHFHSITKEAHWAWCVSIDHSPRMEDIGKLNQKYEECFKDYDSKNAQEKELSIATWYSLLRSSVESLVEEKILWRLIQRYDSHIKVQNLELIAITDEIIQDTINLHWEISESWDMHLSADIINAWVNHIEKIKGFRKRYEDLCAKVNIVKDEKKKARDVKKNSEKNNPFYSL